MRGLVLSCLTLLISFSLAPSHAQAPPEDELIGLWGHGMQFGPLLQGELTVERRQDGNWRATFGGMEGTVEAKGDDVRVAFPEGNGKFRGTLRGNGRTIEGFWIRRGVTEDPRYPGSAAQAFATPLTLKRTASGRWRGDVVPLKDRFKLYLRIFRNDNGMLLGAFRDPYRNDIGGASRFRITREGERVLFSLPNDKDGFDLSFEASLLHEPDRLKLLWPDLRQEIELQRCALDDKNDFLPRAYGEPAYVYRKPEAIGDGWETARAREVGIQEEALRRVVQKVIDGDPAARTPSLIHSILIARRGKLVLEEYFFGDDRETPHDLRSAGKTFASVMLGAAMRKGFPISPDTPVYALLAKRGPFANPDPRKGKITLGHLMTHSSGLACNDNDDASPGNEGTMQSQTAQPDWWKYTLDLPMAHDPGTRYAYCSANMNLVGAALTDATKTWLPELFDRTVAKPLGFGPYHWNLTPTEDGYLGGGAWLRPRDLLKVGQAYLDGGAWKGTRIVDASWVAASTTAKMHVSPETTGLSKEAFGDFYGEGDDAWAWHLGSIHAKDRVYKTYQATGNGGQVLIVAPELQMVVVFTGGNYRQGGIWGRWSADILDAEVVPSIRD